MIEKILLAVSGLGHAEEMLKNLKEIPSIGQAKVTVLHVVPSQATSAGMTTKLEEGDKIIANAVEYLGLDPSRTVTMLRQGEPKDVVCQVADEIDADLIIMGSRGLKRLQAILSNSVSQYVFQLSSRPMLLVKDDIYVKKINRIMVAYDGSDAAKQCLQLALFLLRDIKGGQLVLAYVNKNLSGKQGEVALAAAEKDSVLAGAIAEAKKQGVQTRCVTSMGKPGEEICRLAEDMSVDFVRFERTR
jgi:nucleotide-binding universal stress UspA family protein